MMKTNVKLLTLLISSVCSSAFAVVYLPQNDAPKGVLRSAQQIEMNLGEFSRETGRQDSTSINGILNCNNFIVNKQLFKVKHCPSGMGNSYRVGDKADYFTRYIARYVGLDRIIQANPNGDVRTSYQNQNFKPNFALPEECKFNGADVYADMDARSATWNPTKYDEFWRIINSYRNEYWKKQSTKTKHQLLKVNTTPHDYQNCFAKCDKLEEIRQYAGTFKEDPPIACARGTGTIIKRYYYSAAIPTALNGQLHGNRSDYYVDKADCDSLTGKWQYRGGRDDINNCTTTADASEVYVYSYFDRDAYNKDKSDIRYLKVSFVGQNLSSNIIGKKYILINSEKSNFAKTYVELFSSKNLAKIKSFKIVTDPAQMPAKHKQEEVYIKQIATAQNVVKEDGTAVTNEEKQNALNQVKVFDSYTNQMPVSIMFMSRDNLNNYLSVKKNIYQSGQLLQNDLIRAGCYNVGYANPSQSYYTNANGNNSIKLGCFNLQDNDFDNQHSFNGNNFGYNDLNWNLTPATIDLTQQVKAGLIPFVSYIINDDQTPRSFAVHFVIEYN